MTDTAHATALYGWESILVGILAKEDYQPTSALQVAFSLASNKGTSLSIHVLPPEPSESFLMAGSPLLQLNSETERLDRLTATTLEAAKKFFAQSGINTVYNRSWFPGDSPTQRLLELARTHDITILDSPGVTAGSSEQAIEDCLLTSGHPVLIIPHAISSAKFRRVAIAWDGSAQAARAVKDAMDVLQGAELVVAVTAIGRKDLRVASGADLARYLTSHNIDCKLDTLAAEYKGVAQRLRLFIRDEEIDLLVAGGFAHSRVQEAILGGATASLLDDCPVPLFMSH